MKKILVILVILSLLALSACDQQVGQARKMRPSMSPTQFSAEVAPSGFSSCYDTDGGKNYPVKGTITVNYANGQKREETDRCNPDGTLREWYCGSPNDPAGLLRSENFVKCNYGCSDSACLTSCPTPNMVSFALEEAGRITVKVSGVDYAVEVLVLNELVPSVLARVNGEITSQMSNLPFANEDIYKLADGGWLILREIVMPPTKPAAAKFAIIR